MRTTKPAKAVSKPTDEPLLLPREVDVDRLQRLLDAAGDIVLVLDGEGQILDVRARDPELAKIARRAWRGKAWADTVSGESRDKARELVALALADEPTPPRHLNHIVASGPELPVLYAAVRLSAPKARGAPPRLVALGLDLRETFALQRRLVDAQQSMERDYWRFREAETRYRNLFQSAAEAVLIVDGASQRIVEANPAATTLLSATRGPAKLEGVALNTLFAGSAAEPLAAAVAAARSVGRHERLVAELAAARPAGAAGAASVVVAISSFRQEQASFLLVRLAPVVASPDAAGRGHRTSGKGRGLGNGSAHADASDAGFGDAAHANTLGAAFVRASPDALAFTDSAGRVLSVNRAFVRLAQLSSEDQARGVPLDRWLGRTGVELSVLLANLREGGQAGLFVTDIRGALGLVSEVEIAASALAPRSAGSGGATTGGGRNADVYAFVLRDVGRRLATRERGAPATTPQSPEQLTELVGRVPLKQIVAESSDLIERLSIQAALEMTKDNRAMAAQLLGLSRQSLYVKLRRFGMLVAGDDG